MSLINRQYILRARPIGELTDRDLELREITVPELQNGEVRVRTTWISMDPTIRIWMSDVPQYWPPIAIGDVVRATGTGIVEASKHPDFQTGDEVSVMAGWQTYVQGWPGEWMMTKIPTGVDQPTFLALFGITTGLTAYFGLYDVVNPKSGETLVVDAASGGVGSLVGQLAKIRGCRVIGITGGAKKCEYLREIGFDETIDHHTQDIATELARLCPEGIDICFENIGGPIFDAILPKMKLHGRISLCGVISCYNELGGASEGSTNHAFAQIFMRRVTVHGFLILDFAARFEEAAIQLAQWASEGKIKTRTHRIEGFERLPDALRELVSGNTEKIGKMLVRVS